MKYCRQVLTSSTQLQNSSFHVVERTRKIAKCTKIEKRRRKACKTTGFSLLNKQHYDVLVALVVLVAFKLRNGPVTCNLVVFILNLHLSQDKTSSPSKVNDGGTLRILTCGQETSQVCSTEKNKKIYCELSLFHFQYD